MFTVIQKNDKRTRVLFKWKTDSLKKARILLSVLDDMFPSRSFAYVQYSKIANREFSQGAL